RLFDYIARISVPGDFSGGGQVVQTTGLRFVAGRAQAVSGDVGDQLRAGRCAYLVVNNPELFTFGGQAQHRLGEIIAVGGVDPAGAEDQVFAVAGLDGVFAFKLGLAVDV